MSTTLRLRARGTSTSSTTVVTTPTTTAVKRPRALSIGLIASSLPLPPTLPALPSLPLQLSAREDDTEQRTESETESDVPPLLRLPSELLLQIIRLLYAPCSSPSSPSAHNPFPSYTSTSAYNKKLSIDPAFFALARTCSHLLVHVRDVLYDKVVLGSVTDLARFRRSLIPVYSYTPAGRSRYSYSGGMSGSGSGIGNSVRQLAITCDTDAAYAYKSTSALLDVEGILGNVAVVGDLRKLVVPSLFELGFLPSSTSNTNQEGGIQEVFVRSVNAIFPSIHSSTIASNYTASLRNTTHFCVAEPSTRGWVSPREILDSVFPTDSPSNSTSTLPYKLAHLHFARRADANEDNDVLFVKDVRGIILEEDGMGGGGRFPALKCVVISVYASEWMDDFHSSSLEFDEEDEHSTYVDEETVGNDRGKEENAEGEDEEDSPYEKYAKASHLWGLLDDLRNSLPSSNVKLIIRVGRTDEWADEWETHPTSSSASSFNSSTTRSRMRGMKGMGFWDRCIAEESERERGVLGY